MAGRTALLVARRRGLVAVLVDPRSGAPLGDPSSTHGHSVGSPLVLWRSLQLHQLLHPRRSPGMSYPLRVLRVWGCGV
jgi:hypothetical protein